MTMQKVAIYEKQPKNGYEILQIIGFINLHNSPGRKIGRTEKKHFGFPKAVKMN
jgi:hypothetical protein